MGENGCKWCNWQGLNLQNIQKTLTNQQKKKKKMKNERSKQTFLQRGHVHSQRAHEKKNAQRH